MADNANTNGKSGGSTGIAAIVGGLVVAVLVIGFFVFGGSYENAGDGDVDVQIETPATGGDAANQGGGDSGGQGGGDSGGQPAPQSQ